MLGVTSFGWLNATQFLGALNDNLFKQFIVFFLIALLGAEAANRVSSWAGIVFALPFLVFNNVAGAMADRLSKRTIVVWMKALEVAVMLVGLAAFWLKSPLMLFCTMFLMSLQSALFGPSKYGIVPELVPNDRLSNANGLLVMFTYVAIILGTAMAPWIGEQLDRRYQWAQFACVAIAVLGVLTSVFIERTPPAGSTRRGTYRVVSDFVRTIRSLRGDRPLLMAVLASGYFSLVGAYLQINLIPYGMQHLGLTQEQSGYLFFVAAIGIAAGGVLAGRLSGRLIEFGIVPVGAALITLASGFLTFVPELKGPWSGGLIDLFAGSAAADPHLPVLREVLFLIFLAGLGGGLFLVPVDAYMQLEAPENRRGEILAAGSWLGWLGVLLAAVLVGLNPVMGLGAADGFLFMAGLTFLLTLWAVWFLPDFLIRFLAVTIIRLFYRIRVLGRENLPIHGSGLLVCNHVSFMDAPQILSLQSRRVRFIMNRSMYERNRFMRRIYDLMGVIPISPQDPPRKIVESLKAAREALDTGHLVCIFAEGALTRTGMLREFKAGFERIVRGSGHPVIPVYIGGAWGSVFSHYYGRNMSRLPRRIPYPVTIAFGKPLPPDAPGWRVRQAVMELSCDYFDDLKILRRSLPYRFAAVARRNWGRKILTDTTGRRLSYGQALTATLALARTLKPLVAEQKSVGLLLPTSVGGVLVNAALAFLDKTSVNLNFTASPEAFRSAIRQAGIRTIVTATAFLEKFPDFESLPGLVKIEDLSTRIKPHHLVGCWIRARLWPRGLLTGERKRSADDVATVLFSSGTTGEPKGVMLTHHNIRSNTESFALVIRPRAEDALCATLPFFHSFGYTCGLWFPLLFNVPVVLHANPLDAARIGQAIRENRSTVVFATPTFLLSYIRRIQPEDLKSLRLVVTGAEKLKPRIAEAFREKFGIEVLEGFGATELSPVACLSVPDVDVDGVYQAGHKPGSVGQPVPGVAVRIVDPDTGDLLPPGQPGLMMVRGPNVMLGYLDRPDLTAGALRDGWYDTGDIARMDEDGFVTITDRLSRFSKIGGEMVPHGAVEDELLKGLGRADAVLAVSAVPDEKKGEQLVVLYTPEAGDPARLREILDRSSLPNLWKPGRDAFIPIDHLPLTGSGKLDIKALKQIASRSH